MKPKRQWNSEDFQRLRELRKAERDAAYPDDARKRREAVERFIEFAKARKAERK